MGRQIGSSQESIILNEIVKELARLVKITGTKATTTTTTTIA